jgi:hypothetical protein
MAKRIDAKTLKPENGNGANPNVLFHHPHSDKRAIGR